MARIVNNIFRLGLLMIVLAIIIPIIQWWLLLSLYFTEIYGYSILGISVYTILYWGGLILILPKMILEIGKGRIIGNLLIISAILLIGYIFYYGDIKIAMDRSALEETNICDYDTTRSARQGRPVD